MNKWRRSNECLFVLNGGEMMEKTIKISDKEIKLKSSAYTLFAYQDEFQTDMLDDVSKLQNVALQIKQIDKNAPNYGERCLKLIMPVIKIAMQLLYITAKEADDSIINYQSFLKGIDSLFGDYNWFNGTLECSLSPFKGRLQNS